MQRENTSNAEVIFLLICDYGFIHFPAFSHRHSDSLELSKHSCASSLVQSSMEHFSTAIAGSKIYIPSDSLGNVPFDDHVGDCIRSKAQSSQRRDFILMAVAG